MSKNLWVIRITFLALCSVAGYMCSQLQPDLIHGWLPGIGIGFGLGGFMIAVDVMIKGFSLRAFSAASFGLLLGTFTAWMVDHSQLFIYVGDDRVMWIIRLGMFLGFGYIGMVLAMRSNKEDFTLIIPYVRLASQNKPENLLLLDTSIIVDGRVAALVEGNFLEGILVVPRFVLKELHHIADSSDPMRRARGRRGLETLSRLQRGSKSEVKIHEGDFPDENSVDLKLVRLAKAMDARLFTNDYNLGKIAELQSVKCVNLNELSKSLKQLMLPGETVQLRLVREGKDKGQGIGYLNDGTMVVVNQAQSALGKTVDAVVLNHLQTSAGTIVFADFKNVSETATGA